MVPVVAALQHHLRPPTQTGHPAKEAIGVGQLQVLHGAKQAMGPGPEAPMGGGLHVGVWHLGTGGHRLSAARSSPLPLPSVKCYPPD